MFSLKVSFQGHYENSESTVYYTMVISHLPSEKSWICNRKLDEFHALYNSLSMKFANLPYPPGLSMVSYVNLYFWSPIPGLEAFVNSLLEIKGIYATEEIIGFFDLSLHLEEFRTNKSENIFEFQGRFPTNFLKCDNGVIIALAIDTNQFHRMEQYLQKIGYAGSIISAIYCVSAENAWDYSFVKIISASEWNSELGILALGFEDGEVHFLRIKSEDKYKEYEYHQKKSMHLTAVKGISIDPINSKVFTCGDDARLIAGFLNNSEMIAEVTLPFVPIDMKLSCQSDKVFIASAYKDIHIYDTNTLQPVKVLTVDLAYNITAFTVTNTDTIIVGGNSGQINIYSSKYELLQDYNLSSEIVKICYWESRKLVVVGNKNGIISFWDKDGELIYMFRAHESITALAVNRDRVFSAGNDLWVKTWKIENLNRTTSS